MQEQIMQPVKNIQSVQRAIDIINCISSNQREMPLKEISMKLNLNINTVRGLVNTLLSNGFLSKNIAANSYSLGYEFLSKSQSVFELRIRHIRDLVRPFMQIIAEKYDASCWLQVSFYRRMYTVETVESSNCHYAYAPKPGTHLPLYTTASGKLYLACLSLEEQEKVVDSLQLDGLTEHTITDKEKLFEELERVKRRGYATELEETDLAISSIAVPLFNSQNALEGTISVIAPSSIIKESFKEITRELKKIGGMITAELSFR